MVKKTANLGKVIVGMFQFYPSSNKVPFNCEKCSDEVLENLIEYNRTLDIKSFKYNLCKCKDEWKEVLNRKEGTLEDRVVNSLSEDDECIRKII